VGAGGSSGDEGKQDHLLLLPHLDGPKRVPSHNNTCPYGPMTRAAYAAGACLPAWAILAFFAIGERHTME
jgi:hypothetical protein